MNSLKTFESAYTALGVLKSASHYDISFAWFFELGVELNVQLARANYCTMHGIHDSRMMNGMQKQELCAS